MRKSRISNLFLQTCLVGFLAAGCQGKQEVVIREWDSGRRVAEATAEAPKRENVPVVENGGAGRPAPKLLGASNQARLAYWRFNGGQWQVSEEGIQSIVASNVAQIDSFDGGGLRVSAEEPSMFRVKSARLNGRPSIDCGIGTIRFMFRPGWSTSAGGPGKEAVLVQVGEKGKEGYWAWRINAAGKRLEFRQYNPSRSAESASFTGDLDLRAGQWYEFALVYHRTLDGEGGYSAGFINGKNVAVPRGAHRVWVLPEQSVVESGFLIGSDHRGESQAQGTFDEFEILNYSIDEKANEQSGEAGLSGLVSASPPRVELRWRNPFQWPMTIRKRAVGGSQWETLAMGHLGWSFVDHDVALNTRYEYQLLNDDFRDSFRDRYLQCVIEGRPDVDRGYILLLIDETLADAVRDSLSLLKQDLIGDGWRVIQRLAPRHDDRNWERNPSKIEAVKSIVDGEYSTHGESLKAVYLIGHVAIPHSNNGMVPDGHHDRPFQVDFYYGDTVRRAGDWTDVIDWTSNESANGIAPYNPPVHNGIGDGIFDQAVFPSALELYVGRVDFAGLPAFTSRPPAGISIVSEAALLRQYFEKCHRYRHGEVVFANKVAGFRIPLAGFTGETTVSQGLRLATSMFGLDPSSYANANLFRNKAASGSLWGCEFGAGYYDEIGVGNKPNGWTTANLTDPSSEIPIAFYMLDGSFLGDWNDDDKDTQDNFLRGLLAQRTGGLVSLWGRVNFGDMCLQTMGAGETIGAARLFDVNNFDKRDIYEKAASYAKNIHFGILGDPTLRAHVVRPVIEVKARTSGTGVMLEWSDDKSMSARYMVLVSKDGISGEFEILTPEPIGEGEFFVPVKGGADTLYQVRRIQRVTSGCGTFDCASQAVFASVQ